MNEMKITEFNEINTNISELLEKLSKYNHVDITEAKKFLKETGKKVSNYFYRPFNNEKNGEKKPTND